MHPSYILTIQRNIERAKKIVPWIPKAEVVIGLDAKKAEDKSVISDIRSKTKSHVSELRSKTTAELKISDGEVACTLGHKMILEKFLETSHEYCVVLEDDVEATPLLPKLEQDIAEIFEKNNQALIFILGGQEGLTNYKYIDWKTPFKTLQTGTVYDLTHSAAFIFRTCCYAINRLAAKQLVQYYEKNLIVTDDYLRIVDNTEIKVLFKTQGYFSHPIGSSELAAGRVGINRMRQSLIFKVTGVVLIFFYNRIAQIKPSFYQWILKRILFEKNTF